MCYNTFEDIYIPQDLGMCKTTNVVESLCGAIYIPQDLGMCKTTNVVESLCGAIYIPQDLGMCKTSNCTIQFLRVEYHYQKSTWR